jgi:putative component of toxin-antitoxin plasmid stabilization module
VFDRKWVKNGNIIQRVEMRLQQVKNENIKDCRPLKMG